MQKSEVRSQNEGSAFSRRVSPFAILHSQFSISSPAFVLYLLYLLALPAYCLLRLAGEETWQRVLTFAIPTLLCASGFAHAVETRGWKTAGLLFGSGTLISFAAEALGSGTGFLFGHYSYTDKLGYKLLGLVPWLIPIAWCSMLYPAWHIVEIVERGARSESPHAPRSTLYALRLIFTALAFTAWDLSLDPRMVQDGYWVWDAGGPYFGIPISNYVGWFLTALVIYGVWLRIDGGRRTKDGSQTVLHPLSSVMNLPALAYLVVWLGESMANAVFWAGPRVGLIVFVGMGVFAVPALWHSLKRAMDKTALTP